jgi:hypothetical protein
VNLLIVLSLVFCPFSLSSSAVIHYSLGFLLKNTPFYANINTVIIAACFIYCFSFRCPPRLHTVLHSQRVECCYDQCVCLSVRQSIGIYRSKCLPQSQSALPTLHLDSDFLVFSGIKGMRVNCLQLSPLKCDVKCFVKLF